MHFLYLGKWILKKEFIQDSIKAGKWLDEHLYEWNEQCTVEGISDAHMSSPSRWRKILQQNRSPFEGWKALVVIADAEKRAVYKRYSCRCIFHSFVCSLLLLLAWLFIHPSIHVFVCSFICSFIRLFLHSVIHCFIHQSCHSSSIHLSIQSVNQ